MELISETLFCTFSSWAFGLLQVEVCFQPLGPGCFSQHWQVKAEAQVSAFTSTSISKIEFYGQVSTECSKPAHHFIHFVILIISTTVPSH